MCSTKRLACSLESYLPEAYRSRNDMSTVVEGVISSGPEDTPHVTSQATSELYVPTSSLATSPTAMLKSITDPSIVTAFGFMTIMPTFSRVQGSQTHISDTIYDDHVHTKPTERTYTRAMGRTANVNGTSLPMYSYDLAISASTRPRCVDELCGRVKKPIYSAGRRTGEECRSTSIFTLSPPFSSSTQ